VKIAFEDGLLSGTIICIVLGGLIRVTSGSAKVEVPSFVAFEYGLRGESRVMATGSGFLDNGAEEICMLPLPRKGWELLGWCVCLDNVGRCRYFKECHFGVGKCVCSLVVCSGVGETAKYSNDLYLNLARYNTCARVAPGTRDVNTATRSRASTLTVG